MNPAASATATERPRSIGRTSATAPAYDALSASGPAPRTTATLTGLSSSAAATPRSAGPIPSASEGQNRAP